MLNTDDLMNDRLDAEVQGLVENARANRLQRLQQPAHSIQQQPDEEESVFEQMVADDEAAEEAKKKGGGGGLGAIAGAFMGG